MTKLSGTRLNPHFLPAFALVMLCGNFSRAADAANTRNLIRNPSFENADPAAGDIPASWHIGTIYGKGPNLHEWTTHARTGKRALRLHSMHVTEYMQQAIPIEPVTEKTAYTLKIHARGAGRFHVNVSALLQQTANRQRTRTTLDNRVFGTTDRWLDYSIHGTIPEGTGQIIVYLGTPRHNCNVTFDDLCLRLGSAPKPAQKATTRRTGSPAIAATDCFDLTSFCMIRANPFALGEIKQLTDNDPSTGIYPEIGPGRGARIAFVLPRPARLAAIRFVQSGATSYLLEADTTGDNEFDCLLARVNAGAIEGAWTEYRFSPRPVHAIRIVGLVKSGAWPQWDRSAFPRLAEMRIMAVREPWMNTPATRATTEPGTASPLLMPTNTLPRAIKLDPPGMKTRLTAITARGVCVSPWMFGWNRKKPDSFSKQKIEAYADRIRRLGANHVLLYFEGSGPVLWPSRAVNGIDRDLTTILTSVFAARKIRVLTMFGRGIKPREPSAPWPSWFGQAMGEAVARGGTGFSVCADEYPQCGGRPDPEYYGRALKQELGLEQCPNLKSDTEAYRRFMLFHYRRIGVFHRRVTEQALTRKKDAVLFANWRIDPMKLNTTCNCLAYDILARETKVDYMGTDPYYSDPSQRTFMERCVKLLAASNRPRGAMPILKAGLWRNWSRLDSWKNIITGGSAVAAVMHGATGVNFYRHNYLAINANTHWVREAFALIAFLDQHGLRRSTEPCNIAILHSRASEDFWQHRAHMLDQGDPLRDGIRGYVTQKFIEDLLLQHSIPTTCFYLEREDELEEKLARYPVILLPFPYCVSDRALRAIARARETGSRVIICDRKGEANELGTLRQTPAFADWVNDGRAVFVPEVVERFWQPSVKQEFLRMTTSLLKGTQALVIQARGRNVEGIVRYAARGKVLLALINWEDEPAQPKIKLRLEPGNYRVIMADRYGWRPAGLHAGTAELQTRKDREFLWGAGEQAKEIYRTTVTAKDLSGFSLKLPRQFIRILVIIPDQRRQS